MVKRISEISKNNRITRFFLNQFSKLKKLLGISRPDIDNQFVLDYFKGFYNYAFNDVIGGNIQLSIPDFMGNFYMDARSDILFTLLKFKSYEPSLVTTVRLKIIPDGDVIDVGANIGLYTVLFSKLISEQQRVLIFEPIPKTLNLLRQNIAINNCQNKVIFFEGVATNKPGNYSINYIDGKEEYSSLEKLVHPATVKFTPTSIKVQGETIDNLVAFYDLCPRFIKIDVEGSEYQVLQGAINTLKTYKPILMLELSDDLLNNFKSSSKMIIEYLREINYKIYDIQKSGERVEYPFTGNIIAMVE